MALARTFYACFSKIPEHEELIEKSLGAVDFEQKRSKKEAIIALPGIIYPRIWEKEILTEALL